MQIIVLLFRILAVFHYIYSKEGNANYNIVGIVLIPNQFLKHCFLKEAWLSNLIITNYFQTSVKLLTNIGQLPNNCQTTRTKYCQTTAKQLPNNCQTTAKQLPSYFNNFVPEKHEEDKI